MSEVLISQTVSVTLKAGEWYWLLGLLASFTTGDNATLDKLYAQVMDATT